MIPFESFSYPLFDLNYRGDIRSMVRAMYAEPYEELTPRGYKGLYLHVPFCDTICSFCPFNKSVGSEDRKARYVEALIAELRLVSELPRIASWSLDSVYLGGGTPSVLSERQVVRILETVRANFSLVPNAEISVEVEPKSAKEDMLRAIKEAGGTRVSFGVQTFNPAIREVANLTATLDQVYETIRLSTEIFQATNLDLMVGLPGHTLAGVVEEMKEAGRCGIGSVSVYPVDYVMTLPGWIEKMRSGSIERPAPLSQRSEMFHTARAVLADRFTEQNIYCFGTNSSPPARYMFDTLYGRYADEALGVGAGAYSFVRGLASYNTVSEQLYIDQVLRGELPIASASPGHAYEKGLVFFPKRMSYSLADLEAVGLREIYEPRIRHLVEEGLLVESADLISLSDTGKRMYSELMVHFFSDHQRRLYGRVCDRLEKEVGIIDGSEWSAGTARIRSLGAFSAMTRQGARGARRHMS